MAVKVDGLEGFKRKINALRKSEPQKALKAVREIGFLIERGAKDRAPKRTGRLAGDIRSKVKTEPGKAVCEVGIPSTAGSAKYAVKMHEGVYTLGEKSEAKQAKVGVTVGRKFITRAAAAVKPQIPLIIKKHFGD